MQQIVPDVYTFSGLKVGRVYLLTAGDGLTLIDASIPPAGKWILDQMEAGGFSAELQRTKPYAYSLFTIDAMAGIAQIASTLTDDLWAFQLADGRGMQRGIVFIAPYIQDKTAWPHSPAFQ